MAAADQPAERSSAARVIAVLAALTTLAVGSAVGTQRSVPAGDARSLAFVAESTTTVAVGPAPTTAVPAEVASTTAVPAEPVSSTAPLPPPRETLVIQGVGDVNLDPGYIPNLAANGYGFAFDGLDGLFASDDLTIVNLECAPSDLGQRVPKTFNFRCDPEALPVARNRGVEVANMANNHVLDYGVEAMLDGRANVAEAGIAPVGVGADVAEATAPALFDLGGWTVAVVGMGGVVPADWWLATDDRPGMASGDDIAQMVAAVEAADEVADLVVVSIHWMWELEREPRPDDRERAEAMVAAGADIVFGHHPHRLGELELIDGRPVFWTLGNFIWPRFSDAGATTAVARVVVHPDGELEACLLPAFITVSGQPELTAAIPCGPGAPGSAPASTGPGR
jgi:poly-gamma-glutamate synthesis protein (capsule biosynthesis protein)